MVDDLRLINILASPSQNVKQPGITDSNSTNLPPIVTRFPPGSILAGFIINRDPAGNPVLRTESGDVTFESKLFLKIGTEVEIKIESRYGNISARIVSINGEPPPEAEPVSVLSQGKLPVAPQAQASLAAATQGTPNATPTPSASAPSAPAPSITVSANPTLTGSVVSSPAAIVSTYPTGAPLAIRLVAVIPPASDTVPSTAAVPAQPAAPAATQPQAPLINPTDAAHYAAYRASNVIPTAAAPAPVQPADTKTPAAAGSQPQTIEAKVTGSTPAGETIVQTAQGLTIRVATATPLPNGSTVTLQVQRPTTAPIPTTPLPTIATLTQKWPSLTQVIQLLAQQLSPEQMSASGFSWLATLSQPAGNQQPPASQDIASGLIVFLLALKNTDFKGWMGKDNLQALEEKGHGQLVKTAEGDFVTLARQFNQAQPGHWQSLFFPVAAHGEVQQVRFYWKRDRRKDSKSGKNEDDTRFVIEADLSQMGELQLDGFTRKNPKYLEFDLYIRTRQRLPESMQQDIFSIYNNFGELTGFKGQLAFQTVEEFPVHPLEEIIHQQDVGDVIA